MATSNSSYMRDVLIFTGHESRGCLVQTQQKHVDGKVFQWFRWEFIVLYHQMCGIHDMKFVVEKASEEVLL